MAESYSRAEELADWRKGVNMRLSALELSAQEVRQDVKDLRESWEGNARFQARAVGVGFGVLIALQVFSYALPWLRGLK